MALAVLVAGCGSDRTADPEVSVAAGPSPCSTDQNVAACAYALEYGISQTEASARLLQLSQLTSQADVARRRSDYGGFEVVTTSVGPEGHLALTTVTAGGTVDPSTGMRLYPARVSESEFGRLQQKLVSAAAQVGPVAAVSYDPFDDVVVAWLREGSNRLTADQLAEMMTKVAEISPRLQGISVDSRVIEASS